MSPLEKHHGVPLSLELTRKESDLLKLAARKDKRDERSQVRWLIEAYGTGLLVYEEEGAAARTLLRATQKEVHYPDSVFASTPQDDDTE